MLQASHMHVDLCQQAATMPLGLSPLAFALRIGTFSAHLQRPAGLFMHLSVLPLPPNYFPGPQD